MSISKSTGNGAPVAKDQSLIEQKQQGCSNIRQDTQVSQEYLDIISSSFKLPCGLVVPNRLVKVALSEGLASISDGDPNESHFRLYERWTREGWGMIVTGNIMVTPNQLGTPNDVISHKSPSFETLARWRRHASSFIPSSSKSSPSTPKPISIVQLCHPGRQSPRLCGRPFYQSSVSSSPLRLNIGEGWAAKLIAAVTWQVPRELSEEEIAEVVGDFRRAAKLVRDSGFGGVEIHASHGYLLVQFISPNLNLRKDRYGGSSQNRIRLLLEIIDAIREECPPPFAVGVKLNSADYVKGGLTEDDALSNVLALTAHGGLDFIEISGGTYENPFFMNAIDDSPATTRKHLNRREALFSSFAERCKISMLEYRRKNPEQFNVGGQESLPAIIVTGGFRTRKGMAEALLSPSSNSDSPPVTDLIGIGRPSCVVSSFPSILLSPTIPDSQAHSPPYTIKGVSLYKKIFPLPLVNAGFDTVWHTGQLGRMGKGLEPDKEIGFWSALIWGTKLGWELIGLTFMALAILLVVILILSLIVLVIR